MCICNAAVNSLQVFNSMPEKAHDMSYKLHIGSLQPNLSYSVKFDHVTSITAYMKNSDIDIDIDTVSNSLTRRVKYGC